MILFIGCQKKEDKLFSRLPSDETGITFSNTIVENDSFNILTHEYIYNGGGVGVADFNNDGLLDVFFAGNLVPNQIYLNKGDFKFEDITDKANVNKPGRWNSGVAVVDINNDGWMDVYVCATMKEDSADRRNMLFVNQGLNQEGIPVFIDKANDYKIDDDGYSTSSAFFDYDRDGDLDLYVLTNQRLTKVPTNYRPKIADGSSPNNDRLYRNNGDGTFSNVTSEAGIVLEGFGLGLSISDFNLDGWPDIYVSNDYLSNDILYMNNQNGTFSNKAPVFLCHQSQFSMGNDAADINNDGLPDLITLDMLPETNLRKKTTISNKSYQTYINNEKYGYEYQYVRNMLHLNGGLDKGVKFCEIGQLAGVHQTEWSWSPLFADFDNDGNRDLIITNGFPKDVTDKDFGNYRSNVGAIATNGQLNDSIPVVLISNYVFKNNGDLTFRDVTSSWGLTDKSFSNGAAFADFDNDGDLDYVVNNINDLAFLYKNTLYSEEKKSTLNTSYLRIKLKGSDKNRQGLGCKVTLRYNGVLQYHEHSIYRGFLSSVDDVIHFGLDSVKSIDTVLVQWPDGRMQNLLNVKGNQLLVVDYKNSAEIDSVNTKVPSQPLILAKVNRLPHLHLEADKIDFNIQRTLPHKFSQAGPGVSVGDVNKDGLEDVVIGGSVNYRHSIYLQKPDGSFKMQGDGVYDINKKEEDSGLLLFDADNDDDLDLYIVSGGVESLVSSVDYQNRLYLNDGKGKFKLEPEALPKTIQGGSCVRGADYDGDGDVDLFIGGRVVPGSYPLAPDSYLLQNDKGRFSDVTAAVCSDLRKPGMVTDALWSDFDNDGKVDLILAGEFMSIQFFKNDGHKFKRLNTTGIENNIGWWSSLTAGDFDRDGDIDYVAGNLGLNNNYQVTPTQPLKVYYKDFDNNGSIDPVLACYVRESMDALDKKLYPIPFWDELNSQSPKFRRKFSNFKKYGKATLEEVLTTEDLKGASVLEANTLTSSYIENLGQGKLKLSTLPISVQVAPINGMITADFDLDGNLDIIMVGNDYGNEVFNGRYDAFTGMVLLGNGKGSFKVMPSSKSGFYVPGDAKALVKLIDHKNQEMFIASQNRDSLKVFTRTGQYESKQKVISVKQNDKCATLIYLDNTQERVEFYFGSGYLSQSSRKIVLPKHVKAVIIYNSMGGSRKIL